MPQLLRLRTFVVLLLLSLLVLPAAAHAAPGDGNSANAQLCQHGGWQHVQGTDGTRFTNQGDCVSYAAQGGTLVPIPSPAISATVETTTLGGPAFRITVTGTGFTPGGTVPIDTVFSSGGVVLFILDDFDVTTADATGAIGPYTLDKGTDIACDPIDNPQQATITATDEASGLQASTMVALPCPQ